MSNGNYNKYQGGVHHTEINLFNNLQPTSTGLNHYTQEFKPALQDYVLTQSIYSVDGFISIPKY
jgi:hypothetical protein